MTTNSLKWQELQETKRANAAKEALTAQSNATEAYKASETARANAAKEALTARELAEKERANKTSETFRGIEIGVDTAETVSKELRGWFGLGDSQKSKK